MTLPRPDGSHDGVHYRGGVASAITDVVMNMIVSGAHSEQLAAAVADPLPVTSAPVPGFTRNDKDDVTHSTVDYKQMYKTSILELNRLQKIKEERGK